MNTVQFSDYLHCTVGCHPTRCGEFEKDGQNPEEYFDQLVTLARENKGKVVAVGECGLGVVHIFLCSPFHTLDSQLYLSQADGQLINVFISFCVYTVHVKMCPIKLQPQKLTLFLSLIIYVHVNLYTFLSYSLPLYSV